jgi:hypothetical protein
MAGCLCKKAFFDNLNELLHVTATSLRFLRNVKTLRQGKALLRSEASKM